MTSATQPLRYRQGDVILEKIENIPSSHTEEKPGPKGLVLKFGSATGHMHRILQGARLLKAPENSEGTNDVLVVGDEGADLVHEEHATIHLPAGNYALLQQREYSPEAIRTVMD